MGKTAADTKILKKKVRWLLYFRFWPDLREEEKIRIPTAAGTTGFFTFGPQGLARWICGFFSSRTPGLTDWNSGIPGFFPLGP